MGRGGSRWIVAVTAAVVLCGGCGVTGRDATAVAPTTAPTTTTEGGVIAGLDVEETDPECLADVGLEDGIAWRDVLVPLDDEVDEALTTVDDGLGCIGADGARAVLSDGFGAAFDFWYGTDLDDAEVWCLLEQVASERAPAFTLVDPVGSHRYEELLDALEECADRSDTSAAHHMLIGPEHYGDDDRLDELHDRCETDDRACDLLFIWAGPGTDYDEWGATCGGRRPGTSEFCSDGLTFDAAGHVLPDAPGLDDLAERCGDGDGVSCDLLFALVDEDHPLSELADTCAGRVPDGAYDGCVAEG